MKRAQEATLDSKAMGAYAQMAASKARDMKHSAGGFDAEDFISKLVTFMGGRKSGASGRAAADEDDEDEGDLDVGLDWEKVGYLALRKSRRVIGLDHM